MHDTRTIDPTNPIDVMYGLDAAPGDDVQRAHLAVVHLVVPCRDRYGVAVDTPEAASDYIAETLRGQFLDWGYVGDVGRGPIEIEVCEPYVEGTYLGAR